MIVIYNVSGLLVAIASVVAFLAFTSVSSNLGIGVLGFGLALFGISYWWRSKTDQYGRRRPHPALFFIPLQYVGVVALVFSIPLMRIKSEDSPHVKDPRYNQLQEDDKQLSKTLGGVTGLSAFISDRLQKIDPLAKLNVFTRIEGDRVLALVKTNRLKEYDEPMRRQFLDAVLETLGKQEATKGKNVYVGIKGKLLYGLTRIPPDEVKIGESVPESALMGFYGEPASTPSPTPK